MPITTGWLSREAKVGHIPTPTKRAPGFSLRAYGLLALLQRGAVADERQCPPADARRVRLVLDRGERIVFEGNINIVVTDGRHQSHPIGFESWLGSTIVVELGRLDVAVTNKNRALPPRICEPRQRG